MIIKRSKVVSFFLLGLLIIEFIIFSLITPTNFWGLVGVFLTFGWLSFSTIEIVRLKAEQNNIDEFYLNNMK